MHLHLLYVFGYRHDTLTDCISQVLGLHILGWLGRLPFPPPRCLLVLPPRPLSCGVFPNFDSIFVPRDKDVSNCEGSADLHHSPSIVEFDETSSQISCRDAQSSSELSIPKSPPALLKGSVTTLNVDVLEQTVLHVQNQLLTRLESMNPLQHESMTQGEIHHVVNPIHTMEFLVPMPIVMPKICKITLILVLQEKLQDL
ncbi:uncharacterized protein LOC126691331 [Quercus robur]|uniref:uncharacterized protein LOC126691331 n=1 Tax=Quercus robur TaxID=38942 RepID=UPI002161803F|nr:uncharacterized protein LOC126691331 [Quercus robur]